MKINHKVLSIPPYISTAWINVSALHMRGNTLIVSLFDGETIEVPKLTIEQIDTIFSLHAAFIEEEAKHHQERPSLHPMPPLPFLTNNVTSFRFGFSTNEGFGIAMQHNPEQAETPDLPPDVLEKITAITKIVNSEDISEFPQPIQNCNCMHCQIARSIHHGIARDSFAPAPLATPPAVEVSEQDLMFNQWDIQQTDEKLFTVVNRLDAKERYNVFLGNPIGCTCGNLKCEHILAVLKS